MQDDISTSLPLRERAFVTICGGAQVCLPSRIQVNSRSCDIEALTSQGLLGIGTTEVSHML